MRIFLDQKLNMGTFDGGMSFSNSVCMSISRNNPLTIIQF